MRGRMRLKSKEISSANKFLMQQIRTSDDIKKLGTLLGVWAHPDDETFASSGIMAAAIKNGQKVICVTATKGEAGVQDESRWPATKLADIRTKELEHALDIIGVTAHHWLDYKDGHCEGGDTEAILCICKYIEQYKPDTILTFGPDGMTGHPDHKAVCTWSIEARKRLGAPVRVFHATQTKHQYEDYLHTLDEAFDIFFNIDKPNLREDDACDILFELDEEFRDIKYNALKAMPSQTDIMLSTFDKEFICASLSPEAFTQA